MSSTLEHPVILGAGPVGRAVVASLADRGIRPTVVTRSGTVVDGGDPLAADITDPVAAKSAIADATVVFQCAQPSYHRWQEEFPGLQHSVLDGCEASGAALIALENLYSYGHVDRPMTEDLPMRPTSRKGRVRAAMWDELADAHADGRVQAAAVRASDFYGPGALATAYGERFFPRLIAGKKAEVLGDPDALHSATYVPDVAEAMVRVADDPTSWGQVWHVPTAPAVTQRELVRLAAAAAGSEPGHTVVKPWMLRLVGPFNKGAKEMIEMLYEFEEDFVIDSSAFERHFGMPPTSLEDGLVETVRWFRGRAG